jgi:WS/DGAT/MGAT family acyltransferase
VGPHRRFDWLTLDLGDVKAVKNRLGGTVNDVVLATVAGAVGRLLRRHGVDPRAIDYRAVVPVNVRSAGTASAASNQASAWITSLPVHERDARRRLARMRAMTAHLKASKQALGPWALLRVAEWAGPMLLTLGIRLTTWIHPYNLIVTNIPGPQLPLYLLGSPMLAGYPLVPLFENQGLGVAILSYDGKLFFGINADRDTLPEPHRFVEDVVVAFQELIDAAGLATPAGGDALPPDAARASG